MADTFSVVDALVNDPTREGWRGNTSQWAKRAKIVLHDETRCLTNADRRRIAACICDFRLLRPDLAAHCPVHTRTVWDALYADVCHVVATHKKTSLSMVAWLGALAYYVRQNPRMGVQRVRQIVAPDVATLSVALTDGVWNPAGEGEAVCPFTDRLRTRTVLVLLSATLMRFHGTLADDACAAAVAWLGQRPPSHFCDRLLDLIPDTPLMETLQCKRHKPRSASFGLGPVQPTPAGRPSDLLAHTSLRFFDGSSGSQ